MLACAPSGPAQEGYNKCKDHLRNHLLVPTSLKVTSAYCYKGIVTKAMGWPYEYKICYSYETGGGIKMNDIEYYAYNDESRQIKHNDSSTEFENAKNAGEQQKIKA